jgi:hypothetical protein
MLGIRPPLGLLARMAVQSAPSQCVKAVGWLSAQRVNHLGASWLSRRWRMQRELKSMRIAFCEALSFALAPCCCPCRSQSCCTTATMVGGRRRMLCARLRRSSRPPSGWVSGSVCVSVGAPSSRCRCRLGTARAYSHPVWPVHYADRRPLPIHNFYQGTLFGRLCKHFMWLGL